MSCSIYVFLYQKDDFSNTSKYHANKVNTTHKDIVNNHILLVRYRFK